MHRPDLDGSIHRAQVENEGLFMFSAKCVLIGIGLIVLVIGVIL